VISFATVSTDQRYFDSRVSWKTFHEPGVWKDLRYEVLEGCQEEVVLGDIEENVDFGEKVAPKYEFQELDECLRVGREPGGEPVE
jgi:hypothetical protein